MKLTIPSTSVPPRDLEEATLSHGGRLLTLVVLRQSHVRKDGEVRYKRHVTTYAVERGDGWVRLVKEDGTVYTVTAFGCDCPDDEFQGRTRRCKHWTAVVVELGLLGVVQSELGA